MANVINIDKSEYVGSHETTDSGNVVTGSVFGGGSGGGPMEPKVPLKDYVDAQDSAVESRISERLGGLAKADDIKSIRQNIWSAAGTVVAILLTMLAIAGDRFDGGVGASSLLREQAAVQESKDKAQDAQLELVNQKLDILIKQTAEK